MASQFGFHTAAMVVAGFLSGSAALAQTAWVDPPPFQTAISPAPQVVSPPPLQNSPSIAHSSPKPQSTVGPRSVAAPLPVHPVPSAGRQSSRSKAPLVTRPARTGMAQVAPPRRLSRIGHPTAPRVSRPATTEVAEVGPPRRLSRIGPSFNCRAARSPVEHAICGAPVLAKEGPAHGDPLLSRPGARGMDPSDFVQWNWIVARNRCARARGAALGSLRSPSV